jgi:hypothetical protein
VHRRANGDLLEELFDVLVFERDAAPCPVTIATPSVNEDLAAQSGVLRRGLPFLIGFDDRSVFRRRDGELRSPSVASETFG